MEKDHSSEPSSLARDALLRRGASSTGVLIAVVAAVALVVGAFVWLTPTRGPQVVETGRTTAPAKTTPHDAPLSVIERDAPRVPTSTEAPPAALGPQRFVGRGRIHGEVLAADGVQFPNDWSLVVEPSPTLIGSEYAITKRIEFHAGERAFDVDDLPLAGYQVRAVAPSLNCTDLSVLLVKGSEVVFGTLQFKPSGFIEGRVVSAVGTPADGVAIVLEEVATKLRRTQSADANGAFSFHDVLDGEYKLYVGSAETPLVKPGDIQFRAPSLRFKDVTLPATGTLLVETRSENGAPLSDVEVSGFGTQGGAFRVKTDFQGRARVAWLPPGDYRIEGKSDDERRGRVTLAVDADVDAVAVVHLK
ncbi:MAG: carboxypeptidase-like regulatory domain-containing protein [Planctomycetota bacterium]|nr:carboxypeptidase-like regulatory domain-containing protein [Planctomycetota bacterium]